MSTETNKALVRRIFERGVNHGEVDEIIAHTAPTFIDHDIHVQTGISGGPEDLRQGMLLIRQGFPDIEVTVEALLAEGEYVACRNTWRGTHQGEFNGIPPTGRRVEIGGIVLWRIVDGLITERRACIDTLGLLQQLGVIPSPAASDGSATLTALPVDLP